MATVVLPRPNACKLALPALAIALAASGCGGSSSSAKGQARRVVGSGYTFRAPAYWQVRRQVRAVEARNGDALVSVTTFPLARRFEPKLWPSAVDELDRAAAQLAAREGAKLTSSTTTRLGGVRGRAYVLDHGGVDERIGFALDGRREYQLFCRGAGSACDLLFSSFRILGAGSRL